MTPSLRGWEAFPTPGALTHTRITWAFSPPAPQHPGVTPGSPLCPWCFGHPLWRGARHSGCHSRTWKPTCGRGGPGGRHHGAHGLACFRHGGKVSSVVGKETLDNCHVAEVTPPSPVMAFHVVGQDLPPLASLALGFPPDVAEVGDHVGVIPGPNGHEVPVTPPRAPFLATDSADRSKNESRRRKKPS
jgi:hypothetical protein